MSKQLKTWYRLANKKFKLNETYNKQKTKQDFISDLKQHLDLEDNFKRNEISYEGEKRAISNIKIEWESNIKEKGDLSKINNYSILISAITIIASMISIVFFNNQQISFDNKILILIVLNCLFYFIFFMISLAERYTNSMIFHQYSFYQVCLLILEELESKYPKALNEVEATRNDNARLDEILKNTDSIKKFLGIKGEL